MATSPPRVQFRAGVAGFVPAATATDFAALAPQFYGRTGYVKSFTISGTATAASVVDILVQRSANGGGGTSAAVSSTGYYDKRSYLPTFALNTYSANRSSGGNGQDSTRQVLGTGKLFLGTASVQSRPLTFTFPGDGIALRDLTEWFVANWNGQAVPAGTTLDYYVDWEEEAQVPVQFAGDSTTSNAVRLFQELGNSSAMTDLANLFNAGSNGMRLEDAILNTNGIAYPLVGGNGVLSRLTAGYLPSVLVLCYGINDMRTGAKTRNELISMIDAAIYATINGTTSGATYTSPLGAGTAFVWPATQTANRDCKIILWGPNSLTTDGNGSSYVTLTGRFASGYTVPTAAQQITDDLYYAYEAFRNDSRIFKLVQKQDGDFGRVSRTVAASGLMTDILHPNEKGQVSSARQIEPVLLDALAAAQTLII